MAKRLNKKIVVALTITGMAVTIAAAILMLMNLPGKDPRPFIEQAEQLAQKGEYSEAEQYYYRASTRAMDGSNPTEKSNAYLVLAGEMALKAGDARSALGHWSNVILNDPKHAEAQEKIVEFYLELAMMQGGRLWGEVQEQAEKLCNIAEEKNTKNYVGLHALGWALIEQRAINEENLTRGGELLIEAVEGDKSNPEFANSLSEYYGIESEKARIKGGMDDAREAMANALNVYDVLIKNPSDDPKEVSTAYRYRGQFYLRKKLEADNELETKLNANAPSAEIEPLRKEIADTDAKALSDLQESVRLAPKDVDALIGLGRYWQLKHSMATNKAEEKTEIEGFRARAAEEYQKAIEADPDHYNGYLQLAQLYLEDGKEDEALAKLNERINRGIKRDHYLGWRHRAYMSLVRDLAFRIYLTKAVAASQITGVSEGQKEQELQSIIGHLEDLYKQSAAESPGGEEDPRVLFMKGRLYMVKNDKYGAIKALEEAEKHAIGIDRELKLMLARLYLDTGEIGAAEEAARMVVSAFPRDEAAWALMAWIYVQMRRPDDALNAADRALRINAENRQEKNRRALMAKLEAYKQQRNYTAMADIQRQLVPDESSMQEKLNRAAILRVQGGDSDNPRPELLGEAEKLIREVLEVEPLNSQALQQLVSMLYQAEGKEAEIQNILDRAKILVNEKIKEETAATQPSQDQLNQYKATLTNIEFLSIYADPKVSPEDRFKRTEELIKKGDDPFLVAVRLFNLYGQSPEHNAEALPFLKEAYKLRPEEPQIVDLLFENAIRQEDWKLAEECLEQAIKLGLARSGGNFYRGRLLMARTDQENHLTKAIHEFRAGLEEYPSYSIGWFFLGQALSESGSYEEAAKAFREAVRLNPRNVTANIGLARIAELQGNEAEKQKYLNICTQLAPNHPWVVEELQAISDLRDPQKAIARREEIRKENPDDTRNLMRLAILYARVNQFDRGKEIYEECRKLDPTNLYIAQRYASFLTTKTPPEADAAEKILRELVQSIDPKNADNKATAQLLLAAHLATVAQQGGEGTPKEKWDKTDAAFLAASEISDAAHVLTEIGAYFLKTSRYEKAEDWLRKAIAAARESGQTSLEKRAHRNLIDALLQSRNVERSNDIQKEIDTYRQRFEDPFALLVQGGLYSVAGHDEDAIKTYTEYIEEVPDEVMGYYKRGLTYFRRSQWKDAINDFKNIKRLDPQALENKPRILLATALKYSGRVDDAISEWQSLINDNPNMLTAIQQLFELYLELGRLDSAESLITPRSLANPEVPGWHWYLARIAQKRGQANMAISAALKAAETSQLRADMLDFLLNIYLYFEHFDDLIAFVNEKLSADQRSPLVLIRQAGAYAGKKDLDKAVELYVESLNVSGVDLEAFQDVFTKDIAVHPWLTVNALTDAVDKRRKSNPQERASKLLLAILLQAKRDNATLAQVAQELLEATPEVPKEQHEKQEKLYLLRMLAFCKYNAKQFEECKGLYEKALELNPDDVIVLNNLAYMLMEDLNDPKAGLSYSKRAEELRPTNANVLDTVGWNLVLTGDFDGAIAKLYKAIEMSPQQIPVVHYHIAEAFFRRSNTPDAKTPQEDRQTAGPECQRAHELIMQAGKDPENILEKIVALGDKLGLTLDKEIPAGKK